MASEKKAQAFDVIVVGTGLSGGWAAKELCEGGLKVLLLERGSEVEHPKGYVTATKKPWELPHRQRLTPEEKQRHHIQIRHYSIQEDNKHYYINDLENPYVEAKRYDWVRADVVGGRSLLWARQCYRWSDLDFEANLRDGVGVDWPIRYKDIAPWYDYVEDFIGVSGKAEGLPQLPDSRFLPAMEMNCVEEHFKSAVEAQYRDRRVTIGRSANLTRAIGGRGPCQFRDLCHRGCPFGAYFCTNSATLPAAVATGNLTLRAHSLVNRVLYDEQKGRATGVEVVDTQTGETLEFSSRVVFVNASTLGTAFILLNSVSSRFPNGLGNGSDQVGRNLMDHHKCQGLSASVEGFEDRYYKGRRPNGIYIPRFRNVNEKRKDYTRGFGFQAGAARSGWSSHVSVNEIGAALKEGAREPGSWHFGSTGFGECLPRPENRVTLERGKQDKWGRPQLKIDCAYGENEKTMQKDMAATMGEMMEAASFKNIRLDARMSFPGNCNHEMGTARMGRNPKSSVLNAFNQMHEVPNVFITDGSSMVSSSCVNPSLTYMAMTARACHFAMEEMKKQNL